MSQKHTTVTGVKNALPVARMKTTLASEKTRFALLDSAQLQYRDG
jgi:hypothetical protein